MLNATSKNSKKVTVDLTHGEKVDIIHTWSKLEYLIALNKEDPTSPDGGFL